MSTTWNPSDTHSTVTLSVGDLKATANNASSYCTRANASQSSGKYYWEVVIDWTYAGHAVGVGSSSAGLGSILGQDANGWAYENTGNKRHSNSGAAFGASYTTGDVIGVALDMTAGKIWWAKNNAWQGSGNPAAGTNEAYSGITGSIFPMYNPKGKPGGAGDSGTFRPDSASQSYSPPSGFVAFDAPIPINLLDGKVRIKNDATDLFDGKAKVVYSAINLLDGKAQIKDATTNLLDGKIRIKDTTTNLLDGKTLVAHVAVIDASCPTPTCSLDVGAKIDAIILGPSCEMSAVFRNARIDAEIPSLSNDSRLSVGKRIEGDCPGIDCTCAVYTGRYPPIKAEVPAPTASMSTGLNLDAKVETPSADIVADTHNIASIYGFHPSLGFAGGVSTDNVVAISATVSAFRGILDATVGNVASIIGNIPHLAAAFQAVSGEAVSISGSVSPPYPIRIHAGLTGDSTISGDIPVPTMRSQADFLGDRILRYVRGEVR